MFNVHYTYSRPDKDANAGKIAETVIRPIDTDSETYAAKLLQEYHDARGETIEGTPKFIRGLP